MTLGDIGTIVGVAATVVGTIYAGLTYHRLRADQKPQPRNARAQSMPVRTERFNPRRHIVVLAGMVILAWAATAFDFIDRRWLSVPEPPELPISPENARLDPRNWALVYQDDTHQYMTNVFIINNGKAPASELGSVPA
jgi:hypothetical protein